MGCLLYYRKCCNEIHKVLILYNWQGQSEVIRFLDSYFQDVVKDTDSIRSRMILWDISLKRQKVCSQSLRMH